MVFIKHYWLLARQNTQGRLSVEVECKSICLLAYCNYYMNINAYNVYDLGARSSVVVNVLCYKPEGRRF
jgi:hypothetical protein